VPATIISRCNLINFYKASSSEITDRLKKILESEKIKFDEEALLEIARRADGSFRDAVKLTEIAAQSGKITLEKVDQLIGGSALVEVKKLLELILAKDEQKIAQFFESLRERNFNEEFFVKTLFEYLHTDLLSSLGVNDFKPQLDAKISQFLLTHLSKLDLQQHSPITFLPLELLLLSIVQKAKGSGSSAQGGGQSGSSKNAKSSTTTSAKPQKKQEKEIKAEAFTDALEQLDSDIQEEQEAIVIAPEIAVNGSLSNHLCAHWPDFLQLVESKNLTLAALLRSSQPMAGSNGVAEVKVYYRFHQEQLEQPKLKQIVEECGQKIVGDKIAFKFTLTSPPTEAEVVEVPAQTHKLEALAEEVLM